MFSIAKQVAITLALEVSLRYFPLLAATSCSYLRTTETGSIQSPSYPSYYPPNITCRWFVFIDSDAISRIELTFSAFDLEGPDKNYRRCINDYVVVYLGRQEESSHTIGPFCGSVKPDTITIYRKSFLVKFVSFGDITGRGFKAHYNAYKEKSRSLTSTQATAGIVAAIFCGLIFLGIAVLRCAAVLKCCPDNTQSGRELVGNNESVDSGNYHLDCPPSYRTVMEHPERYPTPTASQTSTPHSTPLSQRPMNGARSRNWTLERIHSVDDQFLPPYPGIINGNLLTGVDTLSVSTASEENDGNIHTTTMAVVNTCPRTPPEEQFTEQLIGTERALSGDTVNIDIESAI